MGVFHIELLYVLIDMSHLNMIPINSVLFSHVQLLSRFELYFPNWFSLIQPFATCRWIVVYGFIKRNLAYP